MSGKKITSLPAYTSAQSADVLYAVTDASSKSIIAGNFVKTVPVSAAGSTTPRSLTARFAEVINVLDYGAVGDGVTDDATAVQAALNIIVTAGFGALYFPAGNYIIGTQVAISSSAQEIAIYGDGVEVTKLTVPSTNTTGALSLTFTDRTSQITVRDMSILADGKQLGTGLKITQPEGGNRHNRTVYLSHLEVKGIDTTEDCFITSIDLTGCWRPLLDAVIVGGPFGTGISDDWSNTSEQFFSTLGIDLDDCYSPALQNCYIWSAATGISSITTGAAEEEGFYMTNTKIVGVKTALDWQRTGREPELWIDNCHWNYRDAGLVFDGAKFISVKGCLSFNEDTTPEFGGTPADIHLKNTEKSIIEGNVFHFDGNPNTRIGVFVDSTTNADNVLIMNNIFSGTFADAVKVGAGATSVVIFGNLYPGTITDKIDDASAAAIVMDPDSASSWRIEGYGTGAARGPVLYLDRRSPSAAAADIAGAAVWRALNASGTLTELASIRVEIDDATNASEDATMTAFLVRAGSQLRVFDLSGVETNNNTAMFLAYKPGAGAATRQRVTVDAVDTAGAGFRGLRVPN